MAKESAKVCLMCEKPLSPGRRKYCSDRCGNRASQAKKYGLSPKDYGILIQTKVCPICGRKVRRWNIDHDHKTNRVRGIVCGTCNQRVLTVISEPIQAFRLLEYLTLPPAMALDGKPRKVTSEIVNRDKRKKKYWR